MTIEAVRASSHMRVPAAQASVRQAEHTGDSATAGPLRRLADVPQDRPRLDDLKPLPLKAAPGPGGLPLVVHLDADEHPGQLLNEVVVAHAARFASAASTRPYARACSTVGTFIFVSQ